MYPLPHGLSGTRTSQMASDSMDGCSHPMIQVFHSVQALSRDSSSPAILRTGRASSREMCAPKYPILFLLRGTGLCSLAMYDCIVRAVGSCLVSFGSLVYLQDASSTWDQGRIYRGLRGFSPHIVQNFMEPPTVSP